MLKIKCIFGALLLCHGLIIGQSFLPDYATIHSLSYQKTSFFNADSLISLNYPQVSTGQRAIDDKINRSIIEHATRNEGSIRSIDFLIEDHASYTERADYEITYNQNNILSIRINQMGCGAYCSTYNTELTYDLLSGDVLTLDDILNSKNGNNDFVQMVNQDCQDQFEYNKKVMLEEYPGIDNYGHFSDAYGGCINAFLSRNLKDHQFLLHKDHLEIVNNCTLSQAEAFANLYQSLRYNFYEIEHYLSKKL